jgi:hypothetical protein
MAGHGPPPKDPTKRVRRNADPMPSTALAGDGMVRGPALPVGFEWPDATRIWWDTWRRSPQSQVMGETDWAFLLDTAVLHARFWDGDTDVAGELRLRVAKFGATPEDRARLRMQIGEAEKPKPRSRRSKAPLRVVDAG